MASGPFMKNESVIARADLVIEPEVSGIKMLAFQEIDRAIEVGRRAAEENLDAIRELLD